MNRSERIQSRAYRTLNPLLRYKVATPELNQSLILKGLRYPSAELILGIYSNSSESVPQAQDIVVTTHGLHIYDGKFTHIAYDDIQKIYIPDNERENKSFAQTILLHTRSQGQVSLLIRKNNSEDVTAPVWEFYRFLVKVVELPTNP